MIRSWRSLTTIFILLAGLTLLLQSNARAQGDLQPGEVYRIGVEDVLRLSVPQASTLDSEGPVQANGTVYVTQIGEVVLAGLTIAEAEEVLLRRLKLYDPGITEVVLGVVEYNALRVFALGALNSPGSFTFQSSPSLWELIRAAGGPTADASLASCRVITILDGRPVSRTVNLTGYLSGHDFPPDVLQSGDTLVVPLMSEGVMGVPKTLGVQVFGGVATPTTVPIEKPTDLLSILMMAGSTMDNAELDKVDWVHRGAGPGKEVATRVDMRLFLERGLAAGNPTIYPGDVVYMPQRQPSWIQQNLPIILASLTTITTLLLTYDRLSD